MKKQSICSLHRQLDDYISDIGNLSLVFNDKKVLVYILGKMRVLLCQAMESGQKMEDRLSAYRLAIENLGFCRDKEHKLKVEIANLKQRLFELENITNE
jgi:hypothetical protein